MGTSAGGGGLARSLPGHLWGRRGRIVGQLYCKYVEIGEFGQYSPTKHQSQGQNLVKGHEYSDQDSERQIVSRVKRYGRHCGKSITCRVRRWHWTRLCEGRQGWGTVRIHLRREEAGADSLDLLSMSGRLRCF